MRNAPRKKLLIERSRKALYIIFHIFIVEVELNIKPIYLIKYNSFKNNVCCLHKTCALC